MYHPIAIFFHYIIISSDNIFLHWVILRNHGECIGIDCRCNKFSLKTISSKIWKNEEKYAKITRREEKERLLYESSI